LGQIVVALVAEQVEVLVIAAIQAFSKTRSRRARSRCRDDLRQP
jgi:hypothetical protein